jgi:hypothetical protein
MTPPARVRYHCLAVPGQRGSQPSLGLDVLLALRRAGLAVRALSIGPAFLAWPPWSDHLDVFAAELAPRYVNVVCAPPGLYLGVPMRASEDHGRKSEIKASDRIYRPPTALTGLHTVGVPNVAVTMPRPRPPDQHELVALRLYDAVLCPDPAGAVEFMELGLENADHARPADVPRIVAGLIAGLDARAAQ